MKKLTNHVFVPIISLEFDEQGYQPEVVLAVRWSKETMKLQVGC